MKSALPRSRASCEAASRVQQKLTKSESWRIRTTHLDRQLGKIPSPELRNHDLTAASVYHKCSVGPSIRPICTRRCLAVTNMIQVCSIFCWDRVFIINTRRGEIVQRVQSCVHNTRSQGWIKNMTNGRIQTSRNFSSKHFTGPYGRKSLGKEIS